MFGFHYQYVFFLLSVFVLLAGACVPIGSDDDDDTFDDDVVIDDDATDDDTQPDDDAADDDGADDDAVVDDDVADDDAGDDDDDTQGPAEFCPPPSDQNGVFVSPTGDDANPGTMAQPCQTIEAALDLAQPAGKTVFVAAGEYQEDLWSAVSLCGGYEAVTWARDITLNVTTIDAETDTTLIFSGDNPVVLEGFTINAGLGTSASVGVAIYNTATLAHNTIDGGAGSKNSFGVLHYSDGELTLIGNVIHGGSGSLSSNGVANYHDATLTGNLIDGGSGGQSCAVYNYFNPIALANNTLVGGTGSGTSLGVLSWRAHAILAGNIVDGGSGEQSLAVGNYQGVMIAVNNTIHGGSGAYLNTGVSNEEGHTTLVNNIVLAGSSSAYYSAISVSGENILVNNDLRANSAGCLLRCGYDECLNDLDEINACGWIDCTEAADNISVVPVFADPIAGDVHLQDISLCIDAGIDPIPAYLGAEYEVLVAFDFDGQPRPYGAGWDIGADEWVP